MEIPGLKIKIFPGRQKPRIINAQVRSKLVNLVNLPDTSKRLRCLVIEYDDDDTQPLTWVQASSGLVVRHEITILNNQRLIMQRDPLPLEP